MAHPGALLAMALFYAATYWLGRWAARRGEGGSFRDMILAGRRLGLGVGVFTMTATWVDGGYVNGTAEQTYASGLLAVQGPWGYALSLVVGGLLFAPIMRRHGFSPCWIHSSSALAGERRRCSTSRRLPGRCSGRPRF